MCIVRAQRLSGSEVGIFRQWISVLSNNLDNKELVWDLSGFNSRQQAIKFVKYFEDKLCVYSGSVEQLYSNYNIYFPQDEDHNMVILPAPHAYHDTFQGIPKEAVKMTGLNIIPGEMLGKKGLYLTIPMKGGTKPAPVQIGLKILSERFPADRPFLPVLMKGDLREFQQRSPILHLHRILLDKMGARSALERNSLRRVIEDKMRLIS